MSDRTGTRAAWLRGPSRVLVIGVVTGESSVSPQPWLSRAVVAHGALGPLQRIWDCIEERTLDTVSRPGAQWRVPECDFVDLPADASWRESLKELAKQ